ncbi:S8 family serine peptidase [Kitasatospora sp. GP82]|uniref:S8 family serine peptidase n=1 Tax=Kitasatospora sp. GP82 TaxID=3035089 RepID=UPI0024735C15|nr:S8 family serine peptidase [Kitasatospora sp. GP82]MDH6126685.1 type VII secretion-associated serine protease mycosin [Kitasatospora sp. GP82]
MTLSRTMRALGATTLAGGLLLTATPIASADQVRDAQWPNQYFDLQKVWSVSQGDGVIVAVIDSGVDASHPDLTGQVLDGYDPSGKGLNAHPTDPHGTSMASAIVGHGHGAGNAEGALGLAPGAKVLPIYKADASDRSADAEDIKWAVDHNAKIINMSIGGTMPDAQMADAVAYAAKHDVLIVAATGNNGVTPVDYPARYPGVLAVGASDQDRKIWSQSNYGPEVLLSAPGTRIVGAGSCSGGQYCIGDGTSGSTAYVSAAAALIRAKFPNLTAGQVVNRLAKSAYVPAGLQASKLPDQHYGYGIIRPYEALTQDIPDGSAQGPLAKPDGAGDTASATKTPAATASGTSSPGVVGPGPVAQPPVIKSNSTASTVLYAAGVGVVLLAGLIAVIVVVSRRRKAAAQPPAYGSQQPYGTPPAWPQQGQPPYPNQPQQPYGNQVPPPGYPPQQPHQNNPYGQGGNQQR